MSSEPQQQHNQDIPSGRAAETVAPAAVFVNLNSDRGVARHKISQMQAAFARLNYAVEIVATSSLEALRDGVERALRARCTIMVAMGGDGTLHCLVNQLFGREVQVGVIPAGGGNDFAAALGIPKNVNGAVEIIAAGKTRLVDIVRVRNASGLSVLYLGGGGMGIDVKALRYANGKFAKWPARLRYLASAIAALRGFQGMQVKAQFPAGNAPTIDKQVLLAAALNTPTCGGGLRLAPQALMDDGLLEVVMIGTLRKREILALLPRLLISGEIKSHRVFRIRAAGIVLSADEASDFQGDGELLGKTPIEVAVLPKALCVLAP